MTQLNNGFLGLAPIGFVSGWYGGDDKDTFIQNRAEQPADWYYLDKKIEYYFNFNGHRCKELEYIDLSNYILFSGCSHTVGVGLELKKSYPYLVSNTLGCDYYNLAMAGTGIDVTLFNIITWISVTKQIPKAIVIQIPDSTRSLVSFDGISFGMSGSWSGDHASQMFIATGDEIGFFATRITLFKKLLQGIAKCPVYMYDSHPGQLSSTGYHDRARDMSHPGIKCHAEYADMICADLSLSSLFS